MSSEQQPIDPQVIEQTKQQIRSLVNEIAQLSRTEMSPEAYYAEFLTRIVTALAAAGGGVWTTTARAGCRCNFRSTTASPNWATTKRPSGTTAACCTAPSTRAKAA